MDFLAANFSRIYDRFLIVNAFSRIWGRILFAYATVFADASILYSHVRPLLHMRSRFAYAFSAHMRDAANNN